MRRNLSQTEVNNQVRPSWIWDLGKTDLKWNQRQDYLKLNWCQYWSYLQMISVLTSCLKEREREGEMFYLTTHSTHFIYGYMASDIWLRTILIVRKETHCRHIGYSYRLTARVLLYAPSRRQDNTYHSLCFTSRGALAGTRNSSIRVWRTPVLGWYQDVNRVKSRQLGLTCTFRASRYIARLSWALVLTWVSPFIQDKNAGVWVWHENRLSHYNIRAEGALPSSIPVTAKMV